MTSLVPPRVNIEENSSLQDFLDSAMKSRGQNSSSGDKVKQITAELGHLFQQQIELTRWEAFVGFTPAELQEYDRVVRESASCI